jgi:hypothetical protein
MAYGCGMSEIATAPSAAARPGAPRSTHFRFEHKVFEVEGARFAHTCDTQEAALYVMLGDLQVALLLPTLRDEFGIKPDSNDSELLSLVERSLRYVKEIRPDDSIPREILDGTASWQVEDRHRMIAKGRLSLQIASWLAGEEAVVVDLAALEQLAEDPLTKQKVDKAFAEIAEKLGMGRERKNELVDRIDHLARELAYIEALRERYGCAQEIIRKLAEFVRTYKNDRLMNQEISRVRTLLMRPEGEFDSLFAQCDAMTGEILSVLRNFDAQVEFVRDMRDDLHTRLMKWDELIAQWRGLDVVKGENQENAIKATYRFAARNFPQRQDWRH